MSNEFVMVPREWVECAVKAGAGEVMVLSDIATLAECLSQERQGEPVAWVYMRNGEVNYDADIVISNTEGDTLGDGDIWVPVFKEFDAIKSEYFERAYELSMESHKNIRAELDDLRAQLYETQRISQEEELRANRYSQQLAKQDALLARTLPYLSNTPDLVQHGAEDLAEEILITSSGKPCYGPNEWGSECGKCSKCKHSSAEPSAPKYHRQPLDMDEAIRERLTLIAREAAISSAHRYSYMPTMPENALQWQPHAWVLEAMRMVEVKACAEVNAMSDLLAHEGSVRAELNGALERVLDERDAVLAKVRWLLSEATHDDGAISAAQFENECLAMLKRIEAILPEGAEPSEECAHSYANGHGCPECGEAFESEPVERDERAAFEDWAHRNWPGAERKQLERDEFGAYKNPCYRDFWTGWQARAALERKPS